MSETIANLGATQLDIDRQRRCGFHEVVFAEGKTIDALRQIFAAFATRQIEGFATRMDAEKAASLLVHFPTAQYNPVARTFRLPPNGNDGDTECEYSHGERNTRQGKVAVISAGTSDLPVAEEARETALWMGTDVVFIQDVGVAGPQRLLNALPLLENVDAIVVVAGMEGALPSMVGGYVAVPVVAVPTSVGYGANFGGLAALLGMLNSCAANVTVVNIDAGFKGGYIAGLIATQCAANR